MLGASALTAAALAAALACGGRDVTDIPVFSRVASSPDAALLSVSGSAPDDVWLVGADGGEGPVVLHYSAGAWSRQVTGVRADLWWVQALAKGTVFMAGSDATVLAYRDGEFEPMDTPGLGRDVVFGVWAASQADVYAVGSAAGRNGFIWHYDGARWAELPLPDSLPLDGNRDLPGFYKVWGASAEDVWVVGDRGAVLRGSAARGFRQLASPSADRLFTVHGAGGQVAMVGGSGNGWALEAQGDALVPITPPGSSLLQGVRIADDGALWAVGLGGNIFERDAGEGAWRSVWSDVPVQSLHAVWVDALGDVWTVGGNVLTSELDAGVALHYGGQGAAVPSFVLPPRGEPPPVCPESELDPAPSASIARRWNEQLLGAIRRDLPRPTRAARNLYHLSVALWDAWAGYDALAAGLVVSERQRADDVAAARREALSYAAHRLLAERYGSATGGAVSRACFDAFMRRLGYDPFDATTEGDSPRAFGNRVGASVLQASLADGADAAHEGEDTSAGANPPLHVDLPGTVLDDPTRWQPLLLAEAVTPNGIPLGSGVQRFDDAAWGDVQPFALVHPAPGATYFELDAPPVLGPELIEQAVTSILQSARLDARDGVRWDISPAGMGNVRLDDPALVLAGRASALAGTDSDAGPAAGPGRSMNPVTGAPYLPQRVLRGDFTRAIAAYWAQGPHAETAPGHWNLLAAQVSDEPRLERRLFGNGEPLDALAWDVHLALALNGALHDAAVASWQLKREYRGVRPISLVRYLAGLGQSSDPALPSYHPAGLPLLPGSIELITEASSAPGERHATLRRYIGEVALRAWPGEPGAGARSAPGARWIRGKDWVPYQSRFYVSAPYPGSVSEQASFARAAAAVLQGVTGSEFFPGGLASAHIDAGSSPLEGAPSEPLELEWATYADAADQAALAATWAGTDLPRDVLQGRRLGAEIGRLALDRARSYFMGAARP
jgi:hypothetical protein